MILRRTLLRTCKDEDQPFPLFDIAVYADIRTTTIGVQTRTERKVQSGRCTKPRKQPTKRQESTALYQHLPLPLSDNPFPFFSLPREIRDLVYSYLVVRQSTSSGCTIDALSIAKQRKKQTAAQNTRDRLNVKRVLCGKTPIRAKRTTAEPILELNLLLASHRLRLEACDIFYSNNWFAITLQHLPATKTETPAGWNLSRIERLQIELQFKDATRMNRYVDWMTFFSSYHSLRYLRIIPTFHQRYYDWAQVELQNWDTTHYVHKAFFKDLLTAIPTHVDLRLGPSPGGIPEAKAHGKLVDKKFLQDMYSGLGMGWNCQGRVLNVEQVVD